MEELSSKIRPVNSAQQVQQSASGKPMYYRIHLHSSFKASGTMDDATFDTTHVFPGLRADLLNGEWEAYVEAFTGIMASQDDEYGGMRLCLPDLCHSSQDVRSVNGGFQVDNAVALIPTVHAYADHDATGGQDLNLVPYVFREKVSVYDIGAKVDAMALFSGTLRIQLRSATNNALAGIRDTERWNATLLFVHKP